MLKLKTITFDKAPKIVGVRAGDLGEINCEAPTTQLRGWRAVVKGAMLVLVSPKGWMHNKQPREWDKDGSVTAWEMPRASCFLQWSTDEGVPEQIAAVLAKGFVSEPFGKPFEQHELEGPQPPKSVNPAELGDA